MQVVIQSGTGTLNLEHRIDRGSGYVHHVHVHPDLSVEFHRPAESSGERGVLNHRPHVGPLPFRVPVKEGGTSLLPVGIVKVDGTFQAGDAVEVRDGRADAIGKGICNYSATELRQVMGMQSRQVREVLPRATDEAVHVLGSTVVGEALTALPNGDYLRGRAMAALVEARDEAVDQVREAINRQLARVLRLTGIEMSSLRQEACEALAAIEDVKWVGFPGQTSAQHDHAPGAGNR